MEKKFSMDEVNNFLANFKKKKGRRAAEQKKESEMKKEVKNNDKPEDIFGETAKTSSIFDNANTNNQDIFNEQINTNNKNNENNFIEENKNNKTIESILNKVPIPKTKENVLIGDNFDNGIVLNNPLLNEQKSKEDDIFEDKNEVDINSDNNNDIFGNQNLQNNIFESNDNDVKDIFGSSGKNDNVDNVFYQPKTNINKSNININDTQNSKTIPKINNKNNLNLKKPLPKPPKLNNKFNSPFINQYQTKEKEESPKKEIENNLDEKVNNETETKKYNNNLFEDINNDIYNKDAQTYNNNIFEENINPIKEFNNNISKNINNEIEKLDDEQTVPPFTDSSNDINENNFRVFGNQINNNINMTETTNQNSRNEINNKCNCNQKKMNNALNIGQIINNDESYSFSGIDQDYILLSDNGGQNILIYNIYSMLNSYSEKQLYEYYFPVSYNKISDLNKLSSLLSIILNNGNELNEPLSHIVVCLLKYILENKMNINQINILNNNELKNKIIEILTNCIRNENKGIITLNNLFNTDILFNNLNNNNSSMANINVVNDISIHPLEYMINLFNEKLLNKNNFLYIYIMLLNIKENDNFNSIMGLEEYDIIFENFELALYIILKYFNNDIPKIKNICSLLLSSYSPKLNLCHFIILKCILNDYEVNNEKNYSKIFVSFLQFPNIEKLLIADIFNFTLYKMSSQYKSIIGKSSILIKYKYTLIMQNYKKDEKLVLLGQKIFENINQFGLISKNNYFQKYLKELFQSNVNISKSFIKNTKENRDYHMNNNVNDNYENKKEEKTEENKEENKAINDGQNQGGLFTSIFNAFGMAGKPNADNNNKENERKIITEEEKRRMTEEELWELEHPDEPEYVYDPKIKRYILRGKIYDDQEEVIQKQRIEKPMIPPPKANKKNSDSNNYNRQNNSSSNVDFSNQMNNIPSSSNTNPFSNPFTNNRINNPFNSSQFQRQQRPSNTNQKFKMNNLTNRYAVGYNKK